MRAVTNYSYTNVELLWRHCGGRLVWGAPSPPRVRATARRASRAVFGARVILGKGVESRMQC